MEKLVIIGAGISGLTAGVYGRLNGFDTEIYEMHSLPGGECTGWKRGEYYFDGCIHWMMGTKPGAPMHDIWQDTGALDDNVEILIQDVFFELEHDGITVKMYRSMDRLERHLLEIAPEDAAQIRSFCRDVRAFSKLKMPTDKPYDMFGAADGIKMGMKMLPMMGLMKKYSAITVTELAKTFRNDALRSALLHFMPEQYTAMSLMGTLASMDAGDSGFPRGGSLAVARRMEQRYLALGGKVHYRAKVAEITVENGRATGIRLQDGTHVPADHVVSCADGYSTVYNLLGGRYVSDEIRQLYTDPKNYPTYTTVQVSLGIGCDLSARPSMLITPVEPIDAGGVVNDIIGFKNYCFDSTIVPQGKSVVTSTLTADFDWWRAKRADTDAYRGEKERIAAEVIAALEQRYPETQGKVEQVDVATPMTYARYCDAWRGAWMSFMVTPGQKIRYLPGNLPGLEGFHLAGQWALPPGGLPGAALTGRWVIQRLCKNAGKVFTTKV